MITTHSFNKFSSLPFELRHNIWESLLPSPSDPSVTTLTNAIAAHILSLPRDHFWGGLSKFSKLTTASKDIFYLMDSTDSPYAALSGCAESRVVAYKHFLPLLLMLNDVYSWFNKRVFPFVPKLVFDRVTGSAGYECNGVTEESQDGVYCLDEFLFWHREEEIEVAKSESEEEGRVKRKREMDEEEALKELEMLEDRERLEDRDPIVMMKFAILPDGISWFDEDEDDEGPAPKRQKI